MSKLPRISGRECVNALERQAFSSTIRKEAISSFAALTHQALWIPILVNEEKYLLDGQHRLQVAKQLCLKYI